MHYASEMHLKTTKIILRYVKIIIDYGVEFENFKNSSSMDYLIVIEFDPLMI